MYQLRKKPTGKDHTITIEDNFPSKVIKNDLDLAKPLSQDFNHHTFTVCVRMNSFDVRFCAVSLNRLIHAKSLIDDHMYPRIPTKAEHYRIFLILVCNTNYFLHVKSYQSNIITLIDFSKNTNYLTAHRAVA